MPKKRQELITEQLLRSIKISSLVPYTPYTEEELAKRFSYYYCSATRRGRTSKEAIEYATNKLSS